MKRIRVAAAALNQTPLDWDNNRKNIFSAIDEAVDRKVSVLCLPELCITGYGCEDAFHSPFVHEASIKMLVDIKGHYPFVDVPHDNMAVSVGFPMMISNALYNCVGLIYNHKIVGIVPKQHLAGDGVHYEPRWFKPWPKDRVDTVHIDGAEVPVGDLLFAFDEIKVGFEICEDAWVADRPGVSLAQRGADVILNPSASHFAFDKHDVRKRFVEEGSRSQNVTYVYSNLLGNESGRIIFDGDTMIASDGKIVSAGPRFSFKDTTLTTAIVDIDKTRLAQSKLASFRPSFDGNLVQCDGFRPAQPLSPSKDNVIEENMQRTVKYDEFSNAATLGLFDYMRKSHSQGFMLSLSGGADSAACAALVYLMCHRARIELGIDEFIKRSGINVPNVPDKGDDRYVLLMSKILTCVYQSTANSSKETEKSASNIAKGIGAKYIKWSIDSIVGDYEYLVEHALNIDLNWDEHDIARQNIQARVRVPALWMLANLNNSLLLSTSNRSEAAVGYSTADGDSAGGLSPIAGIDKAFLLQWLGHLYHSEKYAWLKSVVTSLTPTAELRPSDSNQTDEDDLMPYDILDAIERLAIRDKKSPIEVYTLINERSDQKDSKKLKKHVIKFFELWCRNQWKREKYAVSFHFDDENLDPKTWCRWPVLSSGLKTELEELRIK